MSDTLDPNPCVSYLIYSFDLWELVAAGEVSEEAINALYWAPPGPLREKLTLPGGGVILASREGPHMSFRLKTLNPAQIPECLRDSLVRAWSPRKDTGWGRTR